MRKLSTCFVLPFLVLLFYGCCFQHMYIIRNLSKEPATLILTIIGVKDSAEVGNWEIAGAAEIVPIKKSDLATAFVSKIAGVWDKSGTCKFEIPAGGSADISKLIGFLNPATETTAGFYCSRIEILYGKSGISITNNMEKIFRSKSFSWPGPLVYYLDLE